MIKMMRLFAEQFLMLRHDLTPGPFPNGKGSGGGGAGVDGQVSMGVPYTIAAEAAMRRIYLPVVVR